MGNIIEFENIKKKEKELKNKNEKTECKKEKSTWEDREIVAQRLELLAELYRQGSISNIDMLFDDGPEGSDAPTLIFSSTERETTEPLFDRILNGLSRVVFQDEF